VTFASLGFALFLSVGCGLYQLCPPRWRSGFLLALSYAFYFTWSVKAAAALAGATLITFLAGKAAGNLDFPHRARVAAISATTLLTVYLAILKTAAVMPLLGPGRLALPLGASYYTFKLISYILDIYWGKIEPEDRFISFAAYVAFFPQILAGPIQRPGDFLRQVPPSRTAVLEGAGRIAWGLFKKMVVADQLSHAVGYVFGHMTGLHGTEILAGFYLFPLQLYADFSGLTDIAIGSGLLFGIESPENFDRPFTASSITEFWRRWHITLSRWLADYVFTPLRMSMRSLGNAGLALSICLTMAAIGIWHGFTWGYFVFGLIHGGYLTAEALTSRWRARFFQAHPRMDSIGTLAGRFYVFHLVAISFLFFRSLSLSDAVWAFTHLLAGVSTPAAGLSRLVYVVGGRPLAIGLAGYAMVELAERYRPDLWCKQAGGALPVWGQAVIRAAVVLDLVVIVFLLLTGSGVSDKPFIYEAF
jgi:alginate O-acetyltransferase complex protein AlgI